MMWVLRGTRSAQAALSPPPPWPKQEWEAPEESDISNTLMATLHEVRVKGLLRPHLFLSPTGTTVVMALSQGRIVTLWPPLSRERPQRMRLLLG